MTTVVNSAITQVLLTFNSAKWLERTIEHLLATGLPIIAVDNASHDETLAILQSHTEIEVIALPRNIGAAARNYGVQRATTPYVVFCDDDTWYDLPGLKYAAELFDRYSKLAVITAKILVNKEQRLDPISHIMAQSPLPDRNHMTGKVLVSFMGGASLVRREVYLESGGYDPRFFMGAEEETLGWKILRHGWQMRYISAVTCHHYPSLQNYQNMRHWGLRNTIVNAWLHRPATSAIRWTWKKLAGAPKNLTTLKAIGMIIAAVPWIVRERSVMPAELEHSLQVLERFVPAPLEESPKSPANTTKIRTAH